MDSQEEELYRQHQDLTAKVQELKEQEQKLRLKKNLLEQSWRKKETESSEEAQESMEEMVLRKELATPEQIQKAKRYIQNNHLPMSVLDALIMLDVLDLETAKALKQNLK